VTAAPYASRFSPNTMKSSYSDRGKNHENRNPAKRVARSAGFAICSPRGMGDPKKDASGINASGRYNMNWCQPTHKMAAGAT